MSRISSPSNPKIKEVVKLREGKHRRKTGRFLIDGLREIHRASQSGIGFSEIFILENRSSQAGSIVANHPKTPAYLVSEPVFEKIAFGNRDEGVVVVAEQPERTLESFGKTMQSVANPLVAVLESIEKPGNVGAVFRSADGAGIDGMLIADSIGDLFSPNTIRGSLGTVFQIPSALCGTESALSWLRQQKIGLAVARCEGAMCYTDYDFRRPTAIVLGNEAEGLTDQWIGEDITAISLPMLGIADSLNVSNAAAVLFYEARRQRNSHCDR